MVYGVRALEYEPADSIIVTRGLVLNANILIHTVPRMRVLGLLERYEDVFGFYSPDICDNEARQHLPALLEWLGLDSGPSIRVLEGLTGLVWLIEQLAHPPYKRMARARLTGRNLSASVCFHWLKSIS